MKSVALSLVFSRATTLTPAALSVFSTSFARPFAVGGGVVGDRDLLDLHRFEILGDGGSLLVVAADDAEHVVETLLGQLGVGRRAGDHRDAGLVVHGGRRDRDAGIQVTDHAVRLCVGELLRDGRTELRVGLVVFAKHLELDGLPADLDLLVVGLVDREVSPVVVVLAEVRDLAGERTRRADLDGDRFFDGGRGRGGGFRLRGRRLLGLFLAATIDADDRGGDHRKTDHVQMAHRNSPNWREKWITEHYHSPRNRVSIGTRQRPAWPRWPPPVAARGV